MDVRFEDDLIEIAGDGNYLMLCADRKMLFLDGAVAAKVPLAEIAGFESARDAGEQAVVVRLKVGGRHVQPFPSAQAGFAEDAVAKLDAAAGAWR